jgi:hypothetical protein
MGKMNKLAITRIEGTSDLPQPQHSAFLIVLPIQIDMSDFPMTVKPSIQYLVTLTTSETSEKSQDWNVSQLSESFTVYENVHTDMKHYLTENRQDILENCLTSVCTEFAYLCGTSK